MSAPRDAAVVVMHGGTRRFGVPALSVEGVFALVDILPVPGACGALAGIVNVHGTVAPVVDLQLRFEKRGTARVPGARLVAVRTSRRLLMLLCDAVGDIAWVGADRLASLESLVPGSGKLPHVATAADGLIYIYEPDKLLADEEEQCLAPPSPLQGKPA